MKILPPPPMNTNVGKNNKIHHFKIRFCAPEIPQQLAFTAVDAFRDAACESKNTPAEVIKKGVKRLVNSVEQTRRRNVEAKKQDFIARFAERAKNQVSKTKDKGETILDKSKAIYENALEKSAMADELRKDAIQDARRTSKLYKERESAKNIAFKPVSQDEEMMIFLDETGAETSRRATFKNGDLQRISFDEEGKNSIVYYNDGEILSCMSNSNQDGAGITKEKFNFENGAVRRYTRDIEQAGEGKEGSVAIDYREDENGTRHIRYFTAPDVSDGQTRKYKEIWHFEGDTLKGYTSAYEKAPDRTLSAGEIYEFYNGNIASNAVDFSFSNGKKDVGEETVFDVETNLPKYYRENVHNQKTVIPKRIIFKDGRPAYYTEGKGDVFVLKDDMWRIE